MIRLWKWAYARMYVRFERLEGRDGYTAASASIGLTFVLGAHVLTVVLAVASILDVDVTHHDYKFYAIVLWLAVFAVVYRTFAIKRAADSLISKFRRHSRSRTVREERRLWYYIVGSAFLPFLIPLAFSLARRN